MGKFLTGLVLVLVVLIVGFLMGPRPMADQTLTFDPSNLGADLDAYLAQSEAQVASINDGAQKEIIWADPDIKRQTPLSIIYIHGFSATKYETRPLTDNVARSLGSNLFYTRLTGHGSTGESLANATMNAWVNDMAEAIAIGSRLGNKVLIVAVSTGGTLATWAANNPDLMKNVAGIVLISPNFELQFAPNYVINMPWAETLLPMVAGDTRSFEPDNAEHARWWTHTYPARAAFPMAALLATVEAIDYSRLSVPALFIYSPKDTVVVPQQTAQVIEAWGGPKQTLIVNDSDDPGHHVIAGDIKSPSTTDKIGDAIVQWVGTLGLN